MTKQLYNGNAVLFKADAEGETINIPQVLIDHWNGECKDLLWLGSAEEAEAAIAAGRVIRPQTTFNDETVWEWRHRTH